MTANGSTPDTIVLIHGFWVTPRSWEDWIARYEAQGYRVLAPSYPGFEVEVEALNADPSPIEAVTVPQIVEHLESVVRGLDSPPILIGHSAGGVFVQSCSTTASALPASRSTRRRRRASSGCRCRRSRRRSPSSRTRQTGIAPSGSTTTSGTTRSPTRSAKRSPAGSTSATTSPPRARSSGAAALANIHPGSDDNHVDYGNDDRAPLLFIARSDDHLMPPSIQRSNAKHYKSDTITEVKEFEGPHLLPAAPGWEDVADYALEWALRHAAARTSSVRATSGSRTSAGRRR